MVHHFSSSQNTERTVFAYIVTNLFQGFLFSQIFRNSLLRRHKNRIEEISRIIERMIKLINWIKKRATLKSYVRQLPLFLKKRYGKHKRYSEEEISTSIQLGGFDNSFVEYAYAIFMSRNEFGGLKHKNKALEDYDTLRKEIANSFFSGNTSFTIHDVLKSVPLPKR
jgi:hypothetical protein